MIVGLLIILTISYRQTIYAYPGGGGGLIVARDNLGDMPALTAAASLLTDYILTVAVSISSGVAQVTSAVPESLYPWRVEIALVLVALITIINLRGVKESGSIFAIPTYFFRAHDAGDARVRLLPAMAGTLGTVTTRQSTQYEDNSGADALLILKAFASGCTALTGVEAISNGIMAFKSPKSHNAAQTLMVMSTLLAHIVLWHYRAGQSHPGRGRRTHPRDGHLADRPYALRHLSTLLRHHGGNHCDSDHGREYIVRWVSPLAHSWQPTAFYRNR
ncbi:MAG: amino acid permease [Anaerolineales bacterium]|nr:amino acid permease [Anaerolineales bacterium]